MIVTTYHEAQEHATLNTMDAEDVVVDISQRHFVASVQQRLFEFTMGEALAEAAPGVSNNFEAKRIREAFINQTTIRPSDEEIRRVNEILQKVQRPIKNSKQPKPKVSQDTSRKDE